MPDKKELEKERKLIEEAKKDHDKFTELYDKYFDRIYRYVFRRTSGNRNIAHDITSQTFLDALGHIKQFEWQGFPFSSWLYKIAHNNVIKYYKKSARNNNVSLENAFLVSDEKQNTKDKAENSIASDQINKMMEHLDEEEREILRLKFFEGVSNVEIADILGLSVSNVGVKVFRTLKKAKSLLPSKNDLKKLD
jgi:RNA polymerase sigma-70 factor (ECF subfamily)